MRVSTTSLRARRERLIPLSWSLLVMLVMADAWVTGILTLAGAAVGAIAILLSQALQWRRERATRWHGRRFETYAKFVGDANLCHDALWRIAHRRNRSGQGADVELPWPEANARYAAFMSLSGAVGILASPVTNDAARRLISHINDFKDEIYTKTKPEYANADGPLAPKEQYEERYGLVRDGFISAARQELDIAHVGMTHRGDAANRWPRGPSSSLAEDRRARLARRFPVRELVDGEWC